MKSGGTITFDPSKAVDTPGGDRTRWSENELKAGLVPGTGESLNNISDNTIVNWNGFHVTWGQLKQLMTRPISSGQSVAGANISPEQLLQQSGGASAEAQRLSQELAKLNEAKTKGQPVTLPGSSTPILVANFPTEIVARQQLLQQLLVQMEQSSNPAVSRSDMAHEWYNQAGLREQSNGNGSTSSFRAMSAPTPSSQPGPSGGTPAGNGTGARAMGLPGGGGFGGDPTFAGLQASTSAAYANALYMDGVVSDGLGNVLRNSSEGRKMMMLFFYYARMAESGDLGAMYQFMKFITHIIAKDKARQNISIGTKLIQLQDLDRKATEALMSAPSDDPNKMNEFTKVLQQTQSEQRMIATSQKLMADISQEFAHVTEALIGMTKALQDAWSRVLRISTSR